MAGLLSCPKTKKKIKKKKTCLSAYPPMHPEVLSQGCWQLGAQRFLAPLPPGARSMVPALCLMCHRAQQETWGWPWKSFFPLPTSTERLLGFVGAFWTGTLTGGLVLVTDEEISKRRSQEHTQQIGFYILTSTSNVLQKIMVTSNSIIPAVPFRWEFPMLQLQKLQTGLAEPQEAWEAECYSHVSTERGKEQTWFVFEKTNRNTLNLRCWQSYKFYCFRG